MKADELAKLATALDSAGWEVTNLERIGAVNMNVGLQTCTPKPALDGREIGRIALAFGAAEAPLKHDISLNKEQAAQALWALDEALPELAKIDQPWAKKLAATLPDGLRKGVIVWTRDKDGNPLKTVTGMGGL